MKKLFFLFLLVAPALLNAQDRGDAAYIIKPGSMYTTYKFTPADEDKITRIVGADEFSRIDVSCRESDFPDGMSNLSSFFDNEAYIKEYTTYFVCRFGDNKVLLRVPEGENRTMPSQMKPSKTIYFIIAEDGVSFDKPSSSGINVVTNGTIVGEGVTVTNFGDLYSTYSFGPSDEDDIKDAVGSSKFNDIKTYAHEDNWPADISGFEDRQTNRPKMYNYAVELVCRFGDNKAVLVAPVSSNGHMKGGMRLTHDIYFVIEASSVDFGGSGNSNIAISSTKIGSSSITQGGPVEVINFGDMYSTYSFEPSDSKDIIAAVGRAVYTDIAKYANETNWPSSISGFADRQTNRPKMYKYYVEYLCSFGDKSIIKAPMSKNSHMTGGMKLTHDIYFIINTSSIEAK
jgi:hypothetical protein